MYEAVVFLDILLIGNLLFLTFVMATTRRKAVRYRLALGALRAEAMERADIEPFARVVYDAVSAVLGD